eukprot:GFYU01001224.1.p1 GENE.GFYU01001224.1~~GFYU01001224.1.p1  ORF type:complete len:1526 (+),score=391.82 GFYU01001224.1:213-4790(+)
MVQRPTHASLGGVKFFVILIAGVFACLPQVQAFDIDIQPVGGTTWKLQAFAANFGRSPPAGATTGNLVKAEPYAGCETLTNAAAMAGNIAIITRGQCSFSTKSLNAHAAGAKAVIVVNTRESIIIMGAAPQFEKSIDIPTASIKDTEGVKLLAELDAAVANGQTLPATIYNAAADVADRAILAEIYKGSPLFNATNDPCLERYSWDWVACDRNGKITDMFLESNHAPPTFPSGITGLDKLEMFALIPDTENLLITGTLPTDLGKLTAMQLFAAAGLKLSGTLPESITSWTDIEELSFADNEFEGEIPAAWSTWQNIQEFGLDNNKLNGSISFLGAWPKLRVFSVEVNSFSGSLPEFVAKDTLKEVFLSRNTFSGTFPKFEDFPKLETLWAASNKFTALSNITNLAALKSLDFSGNEITSSQLPVYNSPALETINLSSNKLNGVFDSSVNDLTSLKSINVANNNLTGMPSLHKLALDLFDGSNNQFTEDCAFFAGTVSGTGPIKELFLSNNKLHGDCQGIFPVLQSLQTVDISNNELTGSTPGFPLSIIAVDLSHNNYTGELADGYGGLRNLRVFKVDNNPNLRSLDFGLPTFLEADDKEILFGTYFCPVIEAKGQMQIEIDPTYYGYSLCTCKEGMYNIGPTGQLPNCVECPEGASCCNCKEVAGCYDSTAGSCPLDTLLNNMQDKGRACDVCLWGARGVPFPKNGYFAVSQDEAVYLQCGAGGACRGGPQSDCATGYTGWRCGKCVEGYYELSGECAACPTGSIALSVLLLIIPIGIFIYVTQQVASWFRSGALAIGLDFVQTVNIFQSFGLKWSPTITTIFTAFSFTNLNMNLLAPECEFESDESTISTYWSKWIATMTFPLIMLFIGMVVYGVIKLRVHLSPKLSANYLAAWTAVLTNGFCMFLGVAHATLTRSSLEPFRCIKLADGKSYMLANPSTECYEGSWWWVSGASIALFFLYALGIPALFFYIVRVNYKLLSMRPIKRKYGSVFIVFLPSQPSCYFLSWVKFKKVLLLIGLSLFPEAIMYQAVIGLIVLQLNVFFVQVQPYRFPRNNNVDLVSSLTLLFLLLAGLLFFSEKLTDSEEVGLVALWMTAFALGGATLLHAFMYEFISYYGGKLAASRPWLRALLSFWLMDVLFNSRAAMKRRVHWANEEVARDVFRKLPRLSHTRKQESKTWKMIHNAHQQKKMWKDRRMTIARMPTGFKDMLAEEKIDTTKRKRDLADMDDIMHLLDYRLSRDDIQKIFFKKQTLRALRVWERCNLNRQQISYFYRSLREILRQSHNDEVLQAIGHREYGRSSMDDITRGVADSDSEGTFTFDSDAGSRGRASGSWTPGAIRAFFSKRKHRGSTASRRESSGSEFSRRKESKSTPPLPAAVAITLPGEESGDTDQDRRRSSGFTRSDSDNDTWSRSRSESDDQSSLSESDESLSDSWSSGDDYDRDGDYANANGNGNGNGHANGNGRAGAPRYSGGNGPRRSPLSVDYSSSDDEIKQDTRWWQRLPGSQPRSAGSKSSLYSKSSSQV